MKNEVGNTNAPAIPDLLKAYLSTISNLLPKVMLDVKLAHP